MASTLIIGAQWGDEGKGKIVDYLAAASDYVVRYNGGNNAGHTVENEFGKFALHLIPSGIFNKRATAVIANGTVLDLEGLIAEIELLQNAGISVKERLLISPHCHLVMPYHKLLDRLYEEAKGKAKTGTTGRGIGPVHADKVSYNGIRLTDLLSKTQFSQKLSVQLLVKNKILQAFGEKPLLQKEIEEAYFGFLQKIKPYIIEPYPLLQKAVRAKKNILFEGAQGVFLDNDWGTYPFVTATYTLSGGITQGTGIPVQNVEQILGVVKAYTTRVGGGPFPTELNDKNGENLRQTGNEFGATTGRPRRCGWFDAELIRFAKEVNGLTGIAITKIDVLDAFESINVCVGYTYKGKKINYAECDAEMLFHIKPVYETYKGWKTSTKRATQYDDLPKEAKEYLSAIEKLVDTKILFISTGEKRHDIIKI